MQVFVPFPSPIDTAKCLDKRRLFRQIQEADQILAAIDGRSPGWANHPVVKMYADHGAWLWYYRETLHAYLESCFSVARLFSRQCDYYFKPPFLTQELCDQHKRRLYTKDPIHYHDFHELGKSNENWYVVDGKLLKYINGKQV